MECLFLSPTPRGSRVYLYAVPDGVPIHLKHNELMRDPTYRPIWRGRPQEVPEHIAAQWVTLHPPGHTLYHDYQQPHIPEAGFQTAHESFQSAVATLGHQLDYEPGRLPTEVLVGEAQSC